MRFILCFLLALLLATAGFADTLVLRNGSTVNGAVLSLGGTPREIRVDVGGKIQTFNVADVSSVSFASPIASGVQDNPYPAEFGFLIGEWESQLPGNHWQMRVSWDSETKQFQGILTRNGQGSAASCFQIGELVWKAKPTSQHALAEQQEWGSCPFNREWRAGYVDLERSSRNRFVSPAGSEEFVRIQ
jgi:hypothetical protein